MGYRQRIDGSGMSPDPVSVDGLSVPVDNATLGAGEDLVSDVTKVEFRYRYFNIVSATTTVLKSGYGVLHRIIFNKRIAAGVTTVYDNTSAAGTKIGTITEGAAILSDPPNSTEYNVEFAYGLTVVTSAAEDITVVWS